MKVLVLGATGFIGLPVARALVRAGHEVIGSSRHEESRTALEQDESELCRGGSMPFAEPAWPRSHAPHC